MPARVYKTDKEQLLAEGKLIVSSTDDAKFQHKVELVNLVLSGMTPSALSEFEEDNPKKYGFNVWDGPALSAYISREYGVFLCVRQCQRMFHSLGFSLVRPQTFPSKTKKGLEEERKKKKKNGRDKLR